MKTDLNTTIWFRLTENGRAALEGLAIGAAAKGIDIKDFITEDNGWCESNLGGFAILFGNVIYACHQTGLNPPNEGGEIYFEKPY